MLNQYLLGLLGAASFEELAGKLSGPEFEGGVGEDGTYRFLDPLTTLTTLTTLVRNPKPGRRPPAVTPDELRRYDGNIVRHTAALQGRRARPVEWRYFQYLALLFTELYLDRFFANREALLSELNAVVGRLNADAAPADRLAPYDGDALRKLTFWSATGSGKTLLMHVHVRQYQHYLRRAGRERELDRVILLTPNEGLSQQHLDEFREAGVAAELFDAAGGLFAGQGVQIIDVHKLREEAKEKTVAIDAFEGNNLVLIDEAHRDLGGTFRRDLRRRLTDAGFAFEYSATFGQALKAANRPALTAEYAKSIAFDYSYPFFYGDGYGKDYRIHNLRDDREATRPLYLTACLLTFAQQLLIYEATRTELRAYHVARPLWLFAGGRVLASGKADEATVSDVIDILRFLADFAGNRRRSREMLQRLIGPSPGLLDAEGNEIFADAFAYVGRRFANADVLFDAILGVVYNAPAAGARGGALHVEELKGARGEIALRLGAGNDPFGVINVGDAPGLMKLCEEQGFVVHPQELGVSLFAGLNAATSSVNVLVGAKKFSEGWNSYRVSTMGLMRMGQKEGAEIVQLFGRGVRLRGYDRRLKRHTQLPDVPRHELLARLETLNVFGVRASYIKQFEADLEADDIATRPAVTTVELHARLSPEWAGIGLKTIALRQDANFDRDGDTVRLDVPPTDFLPTYRVLLDRYPALETDRSADLTSESVVAAQKRIGVLTEQHVAMLDLDALYVDVQSYKRGRGWHAVLVDPAGLRQALLDPRWYELKIPPEELAFTDPDKYRSWQEVAGLLLRQYCERLYAFVRARWEAPRREYVTLTGRDRSVVREYQVTVPRSDAALLKEVRSLRDTLTRGGADDWSFGGVRAVYFDCHLYEPLFHNANRTVAVTPVALNAGELAFVENLRAYVLTRPTSLQGKELFLLRNASRGRGLGFYEAGNFYPDFLLWIVDGERQLLTFVDPKGLQHVRGKSDAKIRFARTVKDVERQLGDPNVVLNAFIVSVTPLADVLWRDGWGVAEFAERHVLFQPDDRGGYVEKLVAAILEGSRTAPQADAVPGAV